MDTHSPTSPIRIRTSFTLREQALFAQQLAFLQESGTPLHENLSLITQHTVSQRKAEILHDITMHVKEGLFLSRALMPHRHAFHPLTLSLIRVGEESGSLSTNLHHLAHELRKRAELHHKVLSALIYPFFVTIATIGVTSGLILFIFPKLTPLFATLNIPLPITTTVLLSIYHTITESWIEILGMLILLSIVTMYAFLSFERVRYFVHTCLIHLPIIGTITRLYNSVQCTRTLGLMLNSGIQLRDALTLTSELTSNLCYKHIYETLHAHSEAGGQLSDILRRHRSLFPDMLPDMIHTGEHSGNLSATLMYVSTYYETDMDDRIKNLSNSLEPLLLICMGLTVGFVAIAVITPLYEITRHLQHL